MAAETRVAIASDEDMVEARAEGRAVAAQLGFSRTDATLVATAISEVARNIVVHAGRGEIVIRPVYDEDRHGIVVVARDSGPGIDDPEAAMKDGVGAPGGLGLGLRGAPSAPGEDRSLILDPGIVGEGAAPRHAATIPVERGDTLVFATDGVDRRFADSLVPVGAPQEIAQRILDEHGRSTDDALVLVARYLGPRS